MSKRRKPRVSRQARSGKSKADNKSKSLVGEFNAACTELLSSPIEKIHHDLHKENVTDKRFHEAEEFIRACECVALWRLKQGQLSEDAGFYLAELAARIAESIAKLTEARDIMLARGLPPIVETMKRAESLFGGKFDNRITKRLSIGDILDLKEQRPIELIQMFAALHPDWAELCGIEDGATLLRQPEAELRRLLLSEETWIIVRTQGNLRRLRRLLLSKETWTGTRKGRRFEEKRKHRLAEVIEQAHAIRQMQSPNINCFVEHLWQGRLWSGPNATFEDCAWPTRPPRGDVTAWMKLIMPYLKRVTSNDAKKLRVFRDMLAWRCCLSDGQQIDFDRGARLATASPADIWSQVGAEIRSAWIRMEKQARKQVSENPA